MTPGLQSKVAELALANALAHARDLLLFSSSN